METNTNQKVSCIVNYSYDASEPDELTIRPGDILKEVERLPGGWWRGELRGRWGMFPDNFVSVLTEQNNARPSSVQGRCRAVYSYQPANPDELPLAVGDVLEVLNEVEEGWWKGRRSGRVGVFPSNFVVMLDSSPTPAPPAPPPDPAPALPPKPVKEVCRVLFPYAAVNEDELNLSEGEVVTVVSKEAPDRGWWKGELHGRVGFFPDNFVQLLPAVAHEVEEKKPDRPPSKTNTLYPSLIKYSEKPSSVKELTTSKISMHKENNKEISSQSTVTQSSRNDTAKTLQSEGGDGSPDGQIKKPPVPLKKSPTPGSVSGLLTGLRNKMLSSDKTDKTDKNTALNSSGEWDRTDGVSASKTSANSSANTSANSQPNATNTFDHIERNSILNDPRAGRVKAPRRRPPSQVLRDDTPQHLGLSNGHDAASTREEAREEAPEGVREEVRPRARDWERRRAPWMDELKLNQARKTGSDGHRNSECGSEERRSSHSVEMSKSTSSIGTRISVLESLESSLETKLRTSESKKDSSPPELPASRPPSVQSPTAAGRTITSMLDEVRKPPAPAPPTPATPAGAVVTLAAPLATPPGQHAPSAAPPAGPPAPPVAARLSETHRSPKHDKTDRFPSLERSEKSDVTKFSGLEKSTDRVSDVTKSSVPDKSEKLNNASKFPNSSSTDKFNEVQSFSVISAFSAMEKTVDRNEVTSKFSNIVEKNTSIEKNERTDMSRSSTLELRPKSDKECSEALIAQLNNRILNLEKLIEVQNAKFSTAIDDLADKLKHEAEKRLTLQKEIAKLAQCVTQV